MRLDANGPNLGAMMRVFGIKTWPDKPFSINGNARRVGSTLNIPSLQLDIGATRVSLDALLSNFPTLNSSRRPVPIPAHAVRLRHERTSPNR